MRILIAVASRHGSTHDIAARVAQRLNERGHQVDIFDIHHAHRGDVPDDIDEFDAYIVGSAVYEGHWMRDGRQFLLRNAITLQHAPVWLFCSGPVGDQQVGIDPAHADELRKAVDAVEHRVFPGRLDRDELGRMERWIVDVVRAHDGDYRDWDEIDAWSASIADHLDRAGEKQAGEPST